nr:immunoglobulin heavy chain junction region [Mus musculus]
CSRGTGSFAYW